MNNSRARHLLHMIDATVQASKLPVLTKAQLEFVTDMNEWLNDKLEVSDGQLEVLEEINRKCVYR